MKLKYFEKEAVVTEEEWFDDKNLTDGETFLMALIKHAKSRLNQKIKLPHHTKRRIWKIAINNGWNKQFVQVLREIHALNFILKKNLIRLPKPVG